MQDSVPSGTSGRVLAVLPAEMPAPSVVQFLLRQVCGLEDHGRWTEKTAWEFDLTYDGVPMTLAHRKFGVRVEVWLRGCDEGAGTSAGRRLIGALRKAVRILDTEVLLPSATEQLALGNVTVDNKEFRLREPYEYFRQASADCLAGRGRWATSSEHHTRLYAREQEATYNVATAVQAYFSWLEHILVLTLPFVDYDPNVENLQKLIGDPWRERWRRIFDINHDRAAHSLYSDLVTLAERSRNTWAHGGFDKDSGLLRVHLPGIGATPIRVSTYDKNVHFPLFGIDDDSDSTWHVLDRTDTFLQTSPRTTYGFQHAHAGLQVRFDAEARRNYERATVSPAAFDEFLAAEAEYEDRMYNMDW